MSSRRGGSRMERVFMFFLPCHHIDPELINKSGQCTVKTKHAHCAHISTGHNSQVPSTAMFYLLPGILTTTWFSCLY